MRDSELRFRGKAKLCMARATVWSLALALLIGWTAPVLAQGMALPGKFEINATGAATYSIPLAVPPGTAGVAPALSLSYNSQSRNGLVGMGWSLDGLPSIGRCPRTIAQDGERAGVHYDANDRYCLDGQRLVAISGTYGADGTEYRTEIETFSRIVSRGSAGTGPAWFEVRTKSGQWMEFGNTADSRVLVQGKSTARAWLVNKVSDSKSNYFSITYINDAVNGQAYPSRIDYTGNVDAALATYNSVQFVYQVTRPDAPPAYQGGSLIRTAVLLTNVQAYAGSVLTADYRLAYGQEGVSGRSQLISITPCDPTGSCLPATTLDWQHGSLAITVTSNVASQDGLLNGHRPYVGDFNGDGLADVLWDASSSATKITSSGTRVLWMNSSPGGNFAVNTDFAGQNGTLSSYAPIVADFNRDGRLDIWWYKINSNGFAPGASTQWLSTNTGEYTIQSGTSVPTCCGNGSLFIRPGLTDIDGDNRADLIWSYVDYGTLVAWTTQSDGTVFVVGQNACDFPGSCGGGGFHGGLDFNGDGVGDVMWLGSLWRGNGQGIFTKVKGGLSGYSPYFVDLNDDGRIDIIWDKADSKGRSTGQRRLWLSKGDDTFDEQSNLGGLDGTLAGYRPYFGDFNGDGLVDILWDQADTNGWSAGSRVLWLGKGDGAFTVVSNFGGQDNTLVGYAPNLADFNGDGKTDVLWDSRSGTDTRSTGTRVLWLTDGVTADLVTSITTGVGAHTAITYKSLADPSAYTKDSTSTDPIVDMQGALFVVTRVDQENGVGSSVSTGYAYVGARAHLDGRGFLGFRQITATDLQTNVVQISNYRQDYPFVSLLASATKKLGSTTLSDTSHLYADTWLGGTWHQVFLVRSQMMAGDLDGSSLPAITRTYQYDSFGNATQIVTHATDGFKKTTASTYSNDTVNWLLGRLSHSTVTSENVSPGPPPEPPVPPVPVVVVLTSGSIWTVPSDWNDSNNSIEVIGGGGGGAAGRTVVQQPGGGGGGGGAYAKVFGIGLPAPGTSISFAIGSGGVGGTGNGGPGKTGGDTYFHGASCATALVCAKAGIGGVTALVQGPGGSALDSFGSVKFDGGSGGLRGSKPSCCGSAGGGGGGAAGPHGPGAPGGRGGINSGDTAGATAAGGGGGGSNLGTSGLDGHGGNLGGRGGNNRNRTGGGSPGVAGIDGGGGGGGQGGPATGGKGGDGTEFDSSHGAGGGGGGGFSRFPGGHGGSYGGGGGGGGASTGGTPKGGNGAQGLIVITYTPAPPPLN